MKKQRAKKAIRLSTKLSQRISDSEGKFQPFIGDVDYVYSHSNGKLDGRIKLFGRTYEVIRSESKGMWMFDSRFPLEKKAG